MKKDPRKNSKKKARKRRKRGSARPIFRAALPFLPFVGPPLITAFIYMWLYTDMNIVSIPARDLKDQKEKLIKHNDSVRLRIEELQAPARIESIAREKLGMISPQEYGLVALDEPMQPPEGFSQKPHLAENSLQASRGLESLLGLLSAESPGPVNRGGELTNAPQGAASDDSALQSG
jgi:cell division protein FtsB